MNSITVTEFADLRARVTERMDALHAATPSSVAYFNEANLLKRN